MLEKFSKESNYKNKKASRTHSYQCMQPIHPNYFDKKKYILLFINDLSEKT